MSESEAQSQPDIHQTTDQSINQIAAQLFIDSAVGDTVIRNTAGVQDDVHFGLDVSGNLTRKYVQLSGMTASATRKRPKSPSNIQPEATLGSSKSADGILFSRGSVNTRAGRYSASVIGTPGSQITKVSVERTGYMGNDGSPEVSLRSPRAAELVIKIATRSINSALRNIHSAKNPS